MRGSTRACRSATHAGGAIEQRAFHDDRRVVPNLTPLCACRVWACGVSVCLSLCVCLSVNVSVFVAVSVCVSV